MYFGTAAITTNGRVRPFLARVHKHWCCTVSFHLDEALLVLVQSFCKTTRYDWGSNTACRNLSCCLSRWGILNHNSYVSNRSIGLPVQGQRLNCTQLNDAGNNSDIIPQLGKLSPASLFKKSAIAVAGDIYKAALRARTLGK